MHLMSAFLLFSPLCVSAGEDRLADLQKDFETYSGSPLLNKNGQIVAIHNSWDSTTAMRHAVPHEAIVHFLKKAKARFHTE